MHIQWRDEKNKDAGYFLLREDGSEIHQGHIKLAQRERARKQKKSFEAVILEDYAEKAAKDDTTPVREVQVVRVEAEPHFHDDRYLLALPEHEHPAWIHEHEHSHGEIGDVAGRLRGHELATLEGLRAAEKSLLEHKHPGFADRGHEHPLEEHGHPHEHEIVWHEHREIEAQLATLRNDVLDLNQRLAFLSTELRAAMVELRQDVKAELAKQAQAVHAHDEYATAQALTQHIENATRKASLVVLSQEETGGKRRLIVEEVS